MGNEKYIEPEFVYDEKQEAEDLIEIGIFPDEGGEYKVHNAEIVEMPSSTDMFSTLDEQRKMVSVWRNQMALLNDKSKLKRAGVLLKLIEQGVDTISDKKVQSRLKDSINTPFDQKMYVESIIALSKEMNNLLRLDSLNEVGDAGELNLQIETAGGNKINIKAK